MKLHALVCNTRKLVETLGLKLPRNLPRSPPAVSPEVPANHPQAMPGIPNNPIPMPMAFKPQP